MMIDTDQYVTLSDACKIGGFSQSTGYRLAKSLGIVLEFFGVKIVKIADIETMKTNRRRVGNPEWIESYEIASEAALKAVKSRMAKRGKRESAGR